MNIINPNVELLVQQAGLDGLYKQIELAGRTCYKSEDKITDDSAKSFVDRMIKSKHYAMLEHGTVYLLVPFEAVSMKYRDNKYSQVIDIANSDSAVTTNLRVLVENNWIDDLKYLCEPTEHHQRRITLKFTTNIGVTREGNRHRVNSIAEESTRYCNYTKEKFGGEITICKPSWIQDSTEIDVLKKRTNKDWAGIISQICDSELDGSGIFDNPIDYYGASIAFANICYNNLIRLGWQPQQAREVLPLGTKSDIVYTAFASDWKRWFDLRLFDVTGKSHPNMKEVADMAYNVLCENNLLETMYSDWFMYYDNIINRATNS
jgi:thymidylate synthase (FAD)